MAVAFAAFLLLASAVLAGGYFTSQEVLDLQDRAFGQARKACDVRGEPPSLVPVDDAFAALHAASGSGMMHRALNGVKGVGEVPAKLLEEPLSSLLALTAPLIAGVVLLLIHGLCCTWCPCFSCLRCCKRERRFPVWAKALFASLLLLPLGGILWSAMIARDGHATTSEGLEYSLCTGAKMVNATLSGSSDPLFIGLVPGLDLMQEMITSFVPGSTMVTEILDAVDDTQIVSDSMKKVSGTLGLLSKMFAAAQNVRPKDGVGASLLHECVPCAGLASAVTTADTELAGGLAAALDSVRTTVQEKFGDASLADMKKNVEDSSERLIDMRDMVVNAFEPLVQEGTMTSTSRLLRNNGLYAILSPMVLGLLLLLFGGFTAFILFCFCERRGARSAGSVHKIDPAPVAKKRTSLEEAAVTSRQETNLKRASQKSSVEDGQKQRQSVKSELIEAKTQEEDFDNIRVSKSPLVGKGSVSYRAAPHRCACLTWCCAIYYAILVLIVSGLMTVVFSAMGGVCSMLDDVSGEMLNDVGTPLGVNVNGMSLLIDECFNPANRSKNAKLLDVVFLPNENGTQVPLGEAIGIFDMKDEVLAKFENADQNQGGALNSAEPMVKLKEALGNADMAKNMYADKDEMVSSNRFTEVFSKWTGSEDWGVSCAACADHTLPNGGAAMKGIDTIVGLLESLEDPGSPSTGATCAKEVTCNSGLPASDASACTQGKDFVSVKRALIVDAKFECWHFTAPSTGAQCDVVTENCFTAGGVLESQAFDCDLAAFTAYVQGFEAKLNTLLANMDAAAATYGDKIKTDLRNSIDSFIFGKIDLLFDGMRCGVFGRTYRGFLEGFCAGMVYGGLTISAGYLYCAESMVALGLLMYVLWRIGSDNYYVTHAKREME